MMAFKFDVKISAFNQVCIVLVFFLAFGWTPEHIAIYRHAIGSSIFDFVFWMLWVFWLGFFNWLQSKVMKEGRDGSCGGWVNPSWVEALASNPQHQSCGVVN
jgi:hypothetical protein